MSMANPEVTLYTIPGTCAVVPHILLNHAGLKFKLQAVHNHLGADFTAKNPKQQVPVLIINEDVITENAAIAQAINQLAPEAKLFGDTPIQFIRVCEWLSYFSAAIHAQAWGPYLRPQRFTNDRAAEASVKATSKEKLRDRFALIESRLPNDGWIVGTPSITAADAYLLPFYQWATKHQLITEVEYPKWTNLIQRLQNLESVRKTLYELDKMREDEGVGI